MTVTFYSIARSVLQPYFHLSVWCLSGVCLSVWCPSHSASDEHGLLCLVQIQPYLPQVGINLDGHLVSGCCTPAHSRAVWKVSITEEIPQDEKSRPGPGHPATLSMADKDAAVNAVGGSKRFLLASDIGTQEAKDCGILLGWDAYKNHLAGIKASMEERKDERKRKWKEETEGQ